MPNDGGPLLIGVVCEGPADQRTACLLADRVAQHELRWLEDHLLPSTRCWSGVRPGEEFLPWRAVRSEADKLTARLGGWLGHRLHGHFGDKPGEPDALIARRALLVLRASHPPVAAAFLIRDSDNDPRRRDGLCQARDAAAWAFAVVIGVAHPKRECWLLAAFDPRNDAEKEGVQSLREELGFDPCTQSEKLTAKDDKAKRSAKRVLAKLCGGNVERGVPSTALDTLRERGQKNGLADYLGELESHYVPLFRSRQH